MATSIDRARALDLIASGAQIVDVLPADDYEARHIPGAINIPLKQLTADAAAVLRRDKPVVVY